MNRLIVLYLRASSTTARQSLKQQEAVCQEYLRQDLGFENLPSSQIEVIRETGSGVDPCLPGLVRLRGFVSYYRVQAVVVTDLSRFSRSDDQLANTLTLLDSRAVALHVTSGPQGIELRKQLARVQKIGIPK